LNAFEEPFKKKGLIKAAIDEPGSKGSIETVGYGYHRLGNVDKRRDDAK